MRVSADVIVVGAGIVGCTTAFLLAKKGLRVTLVDKGEIGGCASGFSAGLLNPLQGHGIPGPLDALALESFTMHPGLIRDIQSEMGIDVHPRMVPSVSIALDESEEPALRELLRAAQQAGGFVARWLTGSDVRSLEPRVSARVIKAVYVEGTMQVDSYQYTVGLAQAAQKYGASVSQGLVEGLTSIRGGQWEIVVDGEPILADKVLLAMGPWTGEAVGQWLGARLPVSPLKGQILRLELRGGPLTFEIYRSGGGYVSSKPDGLIWAGTTEESVGFDDRPTQEAKESILRSTIELMPDLAGARVAHHTACLRPLSGDDLPILGEVPGRDGLYVATGAGRKGILLAPVMAQAVADLITTGDTRLPVNPFSPARFMSTNAQA